MARAPIWFDIGARDRTRAAFDQVRRNVTGISRQVGALVGVTTAVAAVRAFDRMIEDSQRFTSELDDTAQMLGFTASSLQEMRYAARETGTQIVQLETGLLAMRRRAGEAIAGNKTFADSFAAVGVTVADLRRLSPEDLFRRVADGLARISDENVRYALADRIFSEAGRRMITLLNQQSSGLSELARQARSTGAVIGDETVAKLKAANDEIERTNDIIRANEAVIAANLTGFSRWKSEWQVFGSEVLGRVVDELRKVNVEIGGFSAAWDRLMRGDISGAIGSLRAGLSYVDPDAALDAFGGPGPAVRDRGREGGGAGLPAPNLGRESDYDKIRERLQFELDMVGRTAREREILNNVRRAGVDIATEEGMVIADLTGQLWDAGEAQSHLNELMQFGGDMLIDTFMLLGDSTADWDEHLQGVLKTLSRVVLQAALLGQGPLAGVLGTAPATPGGTGGLLGSLAASFGGMRAAGGPIRQGKWYIAGEHGPEPVWGGGSGAFAAGYGRGAGGGAASIRISVDVSGARGDREIQRMVAAGVESGMNQVLERVPDISVASVAKANILQPTRL